MKNLIRIGLAAFVLSVVVAVFMIAFRIEPVGVSTDAPIQNKVATDDQIVLDDFCMDCVSSVTYGWPLKAFDGEAGGIGGGIEGEFNKTNTVLDFLIYFTLFFTLIVLYDQSKSKLTTKKKK